MKFTIVALLGLTSVALAQTVTYEAESATLTGVTAASASAGFSGTGYVEGFDTEGDQILFTIPSTTQGLFDIKIRYMAPFGAKYTRLSLNGGAGGDIAFVEGTTWNTADAGQVLLNAGTNTIAIQNNWGWYFIDALTVSPSAPRPPHQVTGALVNKNASPAAKTLMNFLTTNYGKKYISGQQEIAMITWLEQQVGKTPAMAGLDLIDYSPSRAERGTVGVSVEEGIAFDKRGGIITLCWHWNAPVGLIDIPGKEWWRGFYTDSVDFNVETALADTTNANYTLLIRDIDAIAVQLKKLEAANVPILWRPLHEADGRWFWWGAKGPEPCKKLWKILYDRLTNYHKINNLIWVWNAVSADWYPGDDTVDVVSYDSYPAKGDHGPLSSQFNALVALGSDKKLIAATEVGTIPDPDLIIAYGLRWSWFVTWGGEFIQDGVSNSLDFLKKLYAHSFVLTLDEIQGWKNAVQPTSTTTTSTPTSTTTTKTPTTTPITSTTTTKTPTTTPITSTTTTKIPTTTPITTTPTPTSTTTPKAPKWGQCGGVNWTGPTECVTGTTCTPVSPPWYYQCL